ncbi:MAG: GxxExxY protein [Nitrospirae bacterium]|nr:GxxExxY protein [Nitrospirota bacterium]NTW67677.1 GxxExxY protein [Nitrospirota bacterium]
MIDLNAITENIIGCAIEVHRNLGPGLLESVYDKAMCYEIGAKGMRFQNQLVVPILYKGTTLGEHRIDMIVEDEIIVELKAVDRMDPVFKAQILSYMRMTNKKLGLLINFNVPYLKDGIQRIIL